MTQALLDFDQEKRERILRLSLESFKSISSLPLEDKVEVLNILREKLHELSPFKEEPVDYVRWVRSETVHANDYNPNSVAPPEMELLRHSIQADGYTQPIVSWQNENLYEVVDGFHRHRVGKECQDVQRRINGYLPLVVINDDRKGRSDRIAATIRHNRARGKHKVDAMSDIVIELKRRNWSDARISKELGMDEDEVLRLCQITGLADVFKDQQFSEAWEVDGKPGDVGSEIISDIIEDFEADDGERVFHTWEKWECYRAGFYNERPANKITIDQGQELYREFLADVVRFEGALIFITENWKFSCEHYLTNDRMNRIAWLGQASACYAINMPSCCRGGYNLLSEEQKVAADQLALKYLNKWLIANNRSEVSMELARGRTEAELY